MALMKPKKMKTLEKLKNYFKKTSKEQVQKDWKETEKYDSAGVSAIEFLNKTKK